MKFLCIPGAVANAQVRTVETLEEVALYTNKMTAEFRSPSG